uniref:Protein krueppel n=1 Tax=Heliothis virescens TaxID=7102 RepID=A0A2A4JCT4_HELVI
MNEQNVESWASQPDVCRLCLSTSGKWDVSASYISEAGNKEVYSDLLQDCFGISLSYLSEWGPSRMACAMCVSQLRDACSFRKQVEQAEKLFVMYCDSRKDIFNPLTIKTELEVGESLDSPNCVNNIHEDSDDDQKQIQQPKTATERQTSETDKRKQKTILKNKRKRKKISLKEDLDSDTPIAEFSKKNEPKDVVYKDENVLTDSLLEDKRFRHTRPQNGVKQVSERKRVILTCDTVLRNTTACPFRHHKSWFQCFFCQQDFMEINLLRQHMLKTHADIDVEIKKIKRYPRSLQIEISNLECRQCNLTLTDVVSMCRHFVEVHKKPMKHYNDRIKHMSEAHNITHKFKCPICGREYNIKHYLATHIRQTHGQKNKNCSECGMAFITNHGLKKHMLKHSGMKPYSCNVCCKSYARSYTLREHMRAHDSEKFVENEQNKV